MFETSVVRERVVAQRRYGLLFTSLAVHSIIVVGVVAVGIHSVTLPKHPPNELVPFIGTAPPPPQPLGTPHARPQQPPAAQPHAETVQHAATTPIPLSTPTRIPDTIPSVPATDPGPLTSGSGDQNSVANTIGDPNGDPNSVGGDTTSTAPAVPVPETVFRPGAEVRRAVVVRRVEPLYPQTLVRIRLSGTVVMQCIVDKSGNVRDAQVVTSSHPAFNEPALAALRQWRFSPGVYHGQPVDTYFELTINFQAR